MEVRNAGLERIDYVRVLFRGDAHDSFQWKELIVEMMNDFLLPRKATFKTFCSFSRIYDNSAKEWMESFDTWGEAADFYMENIPFTDRPNVTRVDYRLSIGEPAVRMSTIEHVCRINRGKSRRTITRIDSPPRTKSGDRDAGGDFFAIGSKGSERRTALYKRGNEPWALEVQFGKGLPFRIHSEAVDLYLNGAGYTYYSAYMKVAYEHFTKAVREHMHYSVDQITGEEGVIDQQQGFDFQESLLETFEQQWYQMDDAARSVVAKMVLAKPETSVIMREEEIEEPEWLKRTFE